MKITACFILCLLPLIRAKPSDLIQLFNLTATQINEVVDSHNEIRRSVHATNMREIVWDSYLANHASLLARNCTSDHRKGSYQYLNLTIGENIYQTFNLNFFKTSNLTTLAHTWYYDEVDCFNMTTRRCSARCGPGNITECGHYMQLIHHAVFKVGCSMALCGRGYDPTDPNSEGYWMICDYVPFTNYVEYGIWWPVPYHVAASPSLICSDCPVDAPYCRDALCSSTITTTPLSTSTTETSETPIAGTGKWNSEQLTVIVVLLTTIYVNK